MEIHCVPLTILRDGPFGIGMVQEWIDIDESVDLEEFFRLDDSRLRAVALFDAVINNTDRKIGHLIPDADGHLYVCDHGVTFHEDDKLRTVLWQWAGENFTPDELEILKLAKMLLGTEKREIVLGLIEEDELIAAIGRIDRAISTGKFPDPSQDWPAVPWPPF